jgi:hypothetical protein
LQLADAALKLLVARDNPLHSLDDSTCARFGDSLLKAFEGTAAPFEGTGFNLKVYSLTGQPVGFLGSTRNGHALEGAADNRAELVRRQGA